MRVSKFSSLSAKLFYLMTGLIVMTVAGNSWQNGRFFRQYLEANLQDTLILKAKEVSQNSGSLLESWTSQIRIAVNALAAGEGPRQVSNLVIANQELISIAVFSTRGQGTPREMTFAFTPDRETPRFEDQDPKRVGQSWHQLAPDVVRSITATGNVSRPIIVPVASELKIPAMVLAVPFKTGSETIWALALVWQSRFTALLPRSRSLQGFIVDSEGKALVATNTKLAISRKSMTELALTRDALKAQTLFGFRGRYGDLKGREWLGSFVKLPDYGITVLIQQDAKVALSATTRIVRRTAVWGFFFVLIAIMVSFIASSGVTKNLRAVTQATYRIAGGDFSTTLKSKSRDEVGMLSMAVVQMARQIQTLLRSQVDKARVEKELETARMVQSTFFPKDDGRSKSLSISGVYQPAGECGGDWWGHFRTPDGVEFIFIADAMGHGVPAALVTAMAYSSCMTISDILDDRGTYNDSPAAIVSRFNRVLFDAVQGSISMTFFAAVLDMKNGTMRYANAGHNFPIVIPANPSDSRVPISKSQSKAASVPMLSLALKGMPLGIDRNAEYSEKTLDLVAGDKFFFFTDGLIECDSPDGRQWGRKALLEHLGTHARVSAAEMKNEIVKSAYQFFGNVPIKDDVTIVVAEIDSGWQPGAQAVDPRPPRNPAGGGTGGGTDHSVTSIPSTGRGKLGEAS